MTTKAAGRGTGLGLSITRDVIARHGGTIAAASEPGRDDAFTIELPAAPAAVRPSMSKILIVDDDGETCRFMAELLDAAGPGDPHDPARRRSADAGARAVRPARSPTSTSIRRRTAWTSCARSRPATRAGHVVLISGFGTLQTAIEAVRAGAFDYISKPFNITEVKATVERALSDAGGAGARAAPVARGAAAGPDRPHRRHAVGLQADRPRRQRRRAGAHHRRERHRQGARRARDPRARPPRGARRSCRSTAAR